MAGIKKNALRRVFKGDLRKAGRAYRTDPEESSRKIRLPRRMERRPGHEALWSCISLTLHFPPLLTHVLLAALFSPVSIIEEFVVRDELRKRSEEGQERKRRASADDEGLPRPPPSSLWSRARKPLGTHRGLHAGFTTRATSRAFVSSLRSERRYASERPLLMRAKRNEPVSVLLSLSLS